jgi:hypothetical protein
MIECCICNGTFGMFRNHCPFCGARRVFEASHSYQPQSTRESFRSAQHERERVFLADASWNLYAEEGMEIPVQCVIAEQDARRMQRTELVRAYRSDVAFKFIAI